MHDGYLDDNCLASNYQVLVLEIYHRNTINPKYMDKLMSQRRLVENKPNAAHLFESLRYSGYSNTEAIADIIDNSFDAQANNIWIRFEETGKGKEKEILIIISDDGFGMDMSTLDEALRLGSNSNKSLTTNLGKAGLGLKTAGTSIAKKIEVFTKRDEAELVCYTCYDGDLIVEKNEWVKDLREISRNDLSDFNIYDNNPLFDSITGELRPYRIFSHHGTIVMLSNCDRFTAASPGHFKGTLRKHLGEVYRKFLNAGKNIYIDGEAVPINDPLFINGEDKVHFDDEPDVHQRSIQLNIDGKKISFDVVVSILPEVTEAKSRLLNININNQGFYILRNNRQIARAQTLGLFAKHNSLNGVRAEILFEGTIDDFMGLNFAKKEVHPKQSIVDAIAQNIFNPIMAPQRKNTSIKNRLKVVERKKISHSTVEKTFEKKGSLLIKPLKQKSSLEEVIQQIEDIKKDYGEVAGDLNASCQIKFLHDKNMRDDDLFFKTDQVGETTLVKLNVKHPFFQLFIDLEDSIREPMEILLGAIAMSKLRLSEDIQTIIDEQLFREVSVNLKQLLS